MRHGSRRIVGWAAGAFAVIVLSGCVAAGYSDGGVDVGYVGGFYEPYGYDYGGWGRGYHVGPPRGGGGRGAPGRGAPSIPRGGRGGGGGGHGGGRGR